MQPSWSALGLVFVAMAVGFGWICLYIGIIRKLRRQDGKKRGPKREA
jgi:hypothetical protein